MRKSQRDSSLAWLTDRGEQGFRIEKFLDTANRMMVRRDKIPSDAYIDALRALYEAASADHVV